MSRIKIAVLASATTLASVVTAEVHGVMLGIEAGCAALAAGGAARSSGTSSQKSGRHPCVAAKEATLRA